MEAMEASMETVEAFTEAFLNLPREKLVVQVTANATAVSN